MKHKAKGPKSAGKKDVHKKAAEPMKKAAEPMKMASKAAMPLAAPTKPMGGNNLKWAADKKPKSFGTDRGSFGFK